MKKTQDEITQVVEKLKARRTVNPSFNKFGDDNNERIDMQIAILTGESSYSNYQNAKPEIESGAYDTSEWKRGEYGDSDEELFGDLN